LSDPPARHTEFEAALAGVTRFRTPTELKSTIKAMGVLRLSFLRSSFEHKASRPKDRLSVRKDFATVLQVIGRRYC